MFQLLILGVYRLIAVLLVILPVAINFSYRGDVVTSLVYVPSAMLILSLLATYLDKKLQKATDRIQLRLNKHKVTRDSVEPQSGCLVFKHIWHTPAH